MALHARMRAVEYLHERGLRAGAKHEGRPRIDRVGRSLVVKMQDCDRLRELRLARDGNCAPRGAHRFVESRQGIVDRFSGDPALRDGDPGRQAIRKFGDEAPAQEDKLRPGHEALASGDPALVLQSMSARVGADRIGAASAIEARKSV